MVCLLVLFSPPIFSKLWGVAVWIPELAVEILFSRRASLCSRAHFRDRTGTPRNLCNKDFAEHRVNFLVRFASKPLFYWVVPSNCSEISLVLFVRFFGFGVLFWLLIILILGREKAITTSNFWGALAKSDPFPWDPPRTPEIHCMRPLGCPKVLDAPSSGFFLPLTLRLASVYSPCAPAEARR